MRCNSPPSYGTLAKTGMIMPAESSKRLRMVDLGEAVVKRRKALHLNQDELAELAQVSPRFVRALEHGKPTARFDKVVAVLDALGLEIDVRVRRP
jgi:HTH-type transcriptional regulator/antitoxin HipB